MVDKSSYFQELDEVAIPLIFAEKVGVVSEGIIISYPPGAKFALVECRLDESPEDGMLGKILEIEVAKLKKREPGS